MSEDSSGTPVDDDEHEPVQHFAHKLSDTLEKCPFKHDEYELSFHLSRCRCECDYCLTEKDDFYERVVKAIYGVRT